MKSGTIVRIKLDQCMRSTRRTAITLWIDGLIASAATHGDTLSVPWDLGVWLPKCGKEVEAIEGPSLRTLKKTLTIMSMERCVPKDHMWRWKVAFRTAVHSLGPALENVMAVTDGEGAKIVLEAANIDDMATANAEYRTIWRAAFRSMFGYHGIRDC